MPEVSMEKNVYSWLVINYNVYYDDVTRIDCMAEDLGLCYEEAASYIEQYESEEL